MPDTKLPNNKHTATRRRAMTFKCPKCRKHSIQIGDSACPGCGLSLSLGALTCYYLRRGGKRLVKWLREATAIRCPTCQTANPVYAKTCGNCGTAITVKAATQVTLAPPRRRLKRMARAVPARFTRSVVQMVYLFLSAWLCYYYVMRATIGAMNQLYITVSVSIFLVMVLLLLVAWLLPRTVLSVFHRRATWMVKLGVLCNALTLIALLVLNSANWWVPSAVFAGLLAIVYIAARIITRVIWPVATGLGQVYQQAQGGTIDPSKPQGRTGYTI